MNLPVEHDIVVRIKQGDQLAFKELYMKFHARVFNFCMKILNDKDEAKDILQQVFIAIWEQREQLEEEKPAESYIFSIARNKIYQIFRRKISQQAAVEILMRSQHNSDDRVMQDLIFKELESYLEDLIEKLPPKRREIFKLNRNQGFTYKEIAALLEISENTVDTQVRKSLDHIKKEYEKHYK